MATTPPPTSRIHSPPAPRHGAANDHWDPYTKRRSTRSSNARNSRVVTTPPPTSRAEQEDNSPQPSTSRRGKLDRSLSHTMSPPPSTRASPKDHSKGRSRQAGNHIFDQATSGTGNLTSTVGRSDSGSLTAQSLANSDIAMLPTPAKTPVKRPTKPSAGVQSTARVLFRPENVDDLMPANKRRKSGRHVGFTLDSFEGGSQANEEDIQIYTDSKERIPELDTSEDNPFWDGERKVVVPAAPKKAGKGKKLSSELAEMVGREDGYVATFRGKSFFSKFEEPNDPVNQSASGDEEEEGESRKFRRACAQPRTLFKEEIQKRAHEKERGKKSKSVGDDVFDEEEAMTDIEEVVKDSYLNDPLIASLTSANPTDKTNHLSTPTKPHADEPTTPTAFDSFTPPTTLSPARRTRSKHPSIWDEPDSVSSTPEPVRAPTSTGTRPNPFDTWNRTKPKSDMDRTGAGVTKTKKRQGGTMEKVKGAAKRSKGYESS